MTPQEKYPPCSHTEWGSRQTRHASTPDKNVFRAVPPVKSQRSDVCLYPVLDAHVGNGVGALVLPATALALIVALARFLHRRQIYLRV